MGQPDFEKLRVYRLAETLGDEIWRVVLGWPAIARSTVGVQLIRAVDGVGANIAEGTGRTTYKDNRRFVGMARGSLYEAMHWLRRAYTRNLLDGEQVKQFRALTDDLAPRLNAYFHSIGKRREGRTSLGESSPGDS